MTSSSLLEAGSVRALPSFTVATLETAATPPYQPTTLPAIELAAMCLALRFGLPRGRARVIAEMSGMGGRI